jgi:hypothetical protein
MSSPFPGMNPYLEDADIWPDFHGSFLIELRSRLNLVLPKGKEWRVGLAARLTRGMKKLPKVRQRVYNRETSLIELSELLELYHAGG